MITKRNRKSQDGKKKWIEFRTPMNLVVKGEEEKGKQKRWINVKFSDDCDTKTLSRGLLTVRVGDISFPKVYEITEDQTTGKKKYPYVYINEYREFRNVEKEIDNPFVTDESETDETEIDNDSESDQSEEDQ